MRGVLPVCSQCAGMFQHVQSQLLRQIDFLNARIQQLQLVIYKQTQQIAQAEIQYHHRQALPSTSSLPNLPSPINIETNLPSFTHPLQGNSQYPRRGNQIPSHHNLSQLLNTKEFKADCQNDKKEELQLNNLKQNGSILTNEMPPEKAGRTLQSKLSNRRYLI